MNTPASPKPCKHLWVHLETVQWADRSGYGSLHRTDIYHCRHCREMACDQKRHELSQGQNIDRITPPAWYTGPRPRPA